MTVTTGKKAGHQKHEKCTSELFLVSQCQNAFALQTVELVKCKDFLRCGQFSSSSLSLSPTPKQDFFPDDPRREK